MNNQSIFNWNSCGLRQRKPFIERHAWEEGPLIFSIQETKFKKDSNFKISGYDYIDQPLETEGIAQGGVGFLIHNDVVYHRIKLQTKFQAIAIHAFLHKRITVCNIYINPRDDFTQTDLEDLIKQLPKPFILMGDFNCHHTLWHDHTQKGQTPDRKAQIIEKIILENDLNILDEDKHTYERFIDGSLYTSHIDITLVTPDLQTDLEWDTLDENGGSDHIPISIKIKKSYDFNKYTRWNFKKANWDKYRDLAVFGREITDFRDVKELTDYIVNTLNAAAEEAIGKITIQKGKIPKPWWNENCKIATKNKKRAYRKFRRNPNTENHIEYKKANAIAIRTIRTSKQQSWNAFLASINVNTTTKEIWDKINSIKGLNKNKSISALKIAENIILDKKVEIAQALGENYQNISNGQNGKESFKKYREGKDRKIDFTSKSSIPEEYNTAIKLKELRNVLRTSKDTSPGSDGIPYIMIRQLSEESLKYILDFYNFLFAKHEYPEQWKEATIIPILKPGKDATKCTSYRPIALISCLSKIMEKIINKRLMWYLEKHKLINKSQCGFRKGRSTTDHLTRLTSDILEALVNNQYHISIFLDLEKAYDSVWKQVILNQLEKFKMKGNLPFYIQNFLDQRSIKVKVGNAYSEKLLLDLGVPQGSSISVTLFLIAVNTILEFLPKDLQTSLFVDDCRLSLKVAQINEDTQNKLQNILYNLEKWAAQTGFKFAEGKSEMLICTRKIIQDPPNINLTLEGKKIKIVKENKFLGVWFDWRMKWETQIKHLKDSCTRSLNLIKTLAYSKTKTDTKILLQIYQTMILPKLEYGCLAYGTASDTNLKKLDPIHHHGLRLCLGAFHTSPVESLYVESNIHSLSYRRKVLGLQYYARTLTIDRNETICNLYDKRRDIMFRNSKRFETPAIKIRYDMEELGIKFAPIFEQRVSNMPPWLSPEIHVCFEMDNFTKKTIPIPEIKPTFFKHKHTTDMDIYTDGSKNTNNTKVGAGIAIRKHAEGVFQSKYKAQSSKATILTAELNAINMALGELAKERGKTCAIYSDSKGALQTLQQYDPINPIVKKIKAEVCKQSTIYGNNILFCWVPAHSYIPGNERADQAAKQGSKQPASNFLLVTAQDMKAYIQDKGRKWLQNRWDESDKGRKLYNIDPKVGEKIYRTFGNRLDEIKYNRIRIGHSRLTQRYLPAGEEAPICIICQRDITIEHIFTVCPLYAEARKKFFDNATFPKIMNRKSKTKCYEVIKFLKYTKIYSEI